MSGTVPRLALVAPTGMTGPQGATGATGASGPDFNLPALAGANVYGRRNAAWQPVLPLTAGSAVPSGPLTGGISFGATAVGSPLDLSRHIDLHSGRFGFSVTANTLNYVSGGEHWFLGGDLRLRDRTVWHSSGWRLQWNPANGDWFYLDPAGNPQCGFQTSTGRYISWMGETSGGNGHNNTGGFNVAGRGIVYYNIKGHGYNNNWDGVHIYGRVDNAVQYPFAAMPICDERLKQDVAPSQFDCLAALRQVPLFQYRWRDYSDPAKPQPAAPDAPLIPIGFVAQRLYEAAPDLVNKPAQDTHVGATCMWNVETGAMLAALCGAVQQLAAEVEALGG